MKRNFTIIALLLLATITVMAQNGAEVMMGNTDQKLTIGGYGQVDYNQSFDVDTRMNGKLDVHRMVLMTGYKFNKNTQFIAEFEFEHVTEVYVEQAFINHRIKPWLNLRAGLMLIPMGIINEYHEPTMFNGVERPNVDKYIVPSTWREIGAGFAGRFDDLSLKYQLYLVNGFKSYDDGGLLSGSSGLRKGRQKGAESFISSPNLSTKVEWYGVPGLKLAVAGYFGDTQSTLYNGMSKDDDDALATADSSVVGVSMIGLDARYNIQNFYLKAQYNIINLSNTEAYNEFTGKNMGSQLSGMYAELAYHYKLDNKSGSALIPFVRFESYNTHAKVEDESIEEDSYNRTEIIAGLGWKLSKNSMLKGDVQLFKSAAVEDYSNTLNLGLAVWF